MLRIVSLLPFRLARFPAGWNHPADKKSRKIKKLERVLGGKVCNFSGTRSNRARRRIIYPRIAAAVEHRRSIKF
jgi:hypothetical protein